MRILLDVDGVFSDFLGATLQLLRNSGYDKRISESDITNWDIISCIGNDWASVIESGWRKEGWFENLNAYSGSHEAFEKISQMFDEVYFVTAPMPNHKTWAHERISWLKKNFEVDSGQIIIAESKHIIHGDVFIDDSFSNISKWSKNNWAKHPILWSRPYNKSMLDSANQNLIIRFDNWENFFNHAERNILYQY